MGTLVAGVAVPVALLAAYSLTVSRPPPLDRFRFNLQILIIHKLGFAQNLLQIHFNVTHKDRCI